MSTSPEQHVVANNSDGDESQSRSKSIINKKLGVLLQTYFEPAENEVFDEEKKTFKVVCKLCPKTQLISGHFCSNGNLKIHLLRKHSAEHKEYCAAIANEKSNTGKKRTLKDDSNATKKQRKLTTCWSKDSYIPPTQSEFNKLIVTYIVNDMQPLSTVDSDAFRALFSRFLPGLVFPSRRAITTLINDNYSAMVETLRCIFAKLNYVCTTADLWTARNRSYLGVTAHWIDEISFERVSVAIACTRMTGSHTYDAIASRLDDIFTRFRITTKITRTITDNGSNFVKAFAEFQTEFNADVYGRTIAAESEYQENNAHLPTVVQEEVFEICNADDIETQVDFGHLPPHFRCSAHTLNLVATTDAEKAVKIEGPYRTLCRATIGRCTALWVKYSRSSQAADIIKNELGMALTVPTNTRWNSWYDSMRKINEIGEQPLRDLCTKLGTSKFDKRHLDFLCEYLHVMQYLARGLDILQGERNCYFGLLLPTITQIESSIRSTLPTLKYVKPLANAILDGIANRFNRYFKDKEFILASVTLPFFKLSWIEKNEDVTHAKKLLIAEVEKYVETQENLSAPTQSETGSQVNFNQFFTFKNRGNEDIKASTIVDQYLIDGSSEVASLSKFPLIKKIFFRYNTALPSSAPVERLFSGGKLILTPERNRLSDEMFKRLLLLKKNSFVSNDQ